MKLLITGTILMLLGLVPLIFLIVQSVSDCPDTHICMLTSGITNNMEWCIIKDLNSTASCITDSSCPYNITTSNCWMRLEENLCPSIKCELISSSILAVVVIITVIYFIFCVGLIIKIVININKERALAKSRYMLDNPHIYQLY